VPQDKRQRALSDGTEADENQPSPESDVLFAVQFLVGFLFPARSLASSARASPAVPWRARGAASRRAALVYHRDRIRSDIFPREP
jgi:hypothetical protein